MPHVQGPQTEPRELVAESVSGIHREYDSQDRVAVSSIPISVEAKTQSRSVHLNVPARWLDTLLVTASTLPIDRGEAVVVEQIVETLAVLLPDWGIGACLVPDTSASVPEQQQQRVFKIGPSGHEQRGAGVDPARLFPGCARERVYDVEGNGTGSTLHVAGDDPAVDDPESAGNLLAVRAAQVMQRAVQDARRWQHAQTTAEELRHLNAHLVQAEKLASLGQIAAGVVHELNNPLTSIVAYTDYLTRKAKARDGDADDLERLRRINESAGRMLRFTRDLVTYARPSSETPVEVCIHTVIDQALAFCEHVLERAGATVERHYASDLPTVYGMPEQLAQVFVNLVTNACHAMPEQGGRLVVATSPGGRAGWAGPEPVGDPPAELIVVAVEDNGHGIADEHLPHIFAPFFTTKTDGRGTGLGLSIVKNIVDHHDGEIRAEGVTPRGTRFVLTLPTRK